MRELFPCFTLSSVQQLVEEVTGRVTTPKFHRHLPHREISGRDDKSVRPLACQPIDLARPHPVTTAGIPNSTAGFGFHQMISALEMSCFWTRRTSPPFLAARRACKSFGETSP